jgi:hypothetical protein
MQTYISFAFSNILKCAKIGMETIANAYGATLEKVQPKINFDSLIISIF